MAQELGDIVILQKGAQDIISNGQRTEISDAQGGLKRCGGQGGERGARARRDSLMLILLSIYQ